MAPTGTQVQVAIGSGWLVLGLFWLYQSTIVASSSIGLLFCVVSGLAAGANAVVVYRRARAGGQAPDFTRARWSAPSVQPTPPVAPSPPSLPEHILAPDPEPPPAPVWAPAPLVARAPQGRRPPPPVRLDPQVQPGPGFQPWPEPQFQPGARPEPEASPEPDPELRWRRPRPGRS